MLPKKIFSLLVVLSLSGCAFFEKSVYVRGIDDYIEGFPELEESIVYLPTNEMREKCYNKSSHSRRSDVLACSSINFIDKKCTIYITKDHEPWVMEHEKAHCKGGDHDGTVAEGFKKWKEWDENLKYAIKKRLGEIKSVRNNDFNQALD